MKLKASPSKNEQNDLFKSEITAFIAMDHPMVTLARQVDWGNFDKVFGASFCEKKGRPAINTRLMVALHYLKYTFNLSDEVVVQTWSENPYWQFLSGMKYFQHDLPIDPSSMTRWRKRIGKDGMEEMLTEVEGTVGNRPSDSCSKAPGQKENLQPSRAARRVRRQRQGA